MVVRRQPDDIVNCLDCHWAGLANELGKYHRTGPCGKIHEIDRCPKCDSGFINPLIPADLEDD